MRTFRVYIIFTLAIIPRIVLGQIVSDFSLDTTQGCSPVTINFTNKSSPSHLRYLWSFGNGNVSTKENPQAIYYIPGKYTISLEVTDSAGNKNIKTLTNYITVFKNPKADLGGSPLTGCVPLSVPFQNLSKKGDIGFKKFLWDFGDGNTTDQFEPTHIFKTDGTFDISLLVTDSNNCQSEIIKNAFVATDRLPVIQFTANQTFNCTAPFTVIFSDKSVRTTSADTYLWDFGDGNTSTLRNPQHTYTTTGNFDVRLTITTPNGCSTTQNKTKYILINSIQADFEANNTSLCMPEEVTFTSTSLPTNLQTRWDFGDGNEGYGNTVKHTYTTPGNYSVTIYVQSSASCKSEYRRPGYINVYNKPKASFTINDSTGCKLPFSIFAESTSKFTISGKWFSNDVFINGGLLSTNLFLDYGTYNYKFVAENQYGCKDSAETNILLKPIEIDLVADKQDGCMELDVLFTDDSEIENTVVSKLWTFGNGASSTSNSLQVKNTYQDTGSYTARLKVTTAEGCIGEDTVVIKVGQKTNPSFTINQDSFCNNDQLLLDNTTDLYKPKIGSITWHVYADGGFMNGDSMKNVAEFYRDKKWYDDYNDTLKKRSSWYTAALITEHNGCFDTLIKEKSFFVKDPYAEIVKGPYKSCFSDSIILTNNSTGEEYFYWLINSKLGGIDSAYTDTIILYRDLHGDATITLYATNYTTGCTDYEETKITFDELFEADFEITGERCSPANLSFRGTKSINSKNNYSFDWNIDGTKYLDRQTVYHRFENSGKYTINLLVKQIPSMCEDTISHEVLVTGPSVSGSVSSSASCPPVAVKLTSDQASTNLDSLYWEVEGRKIMITGAGVLYDTLFTPGKDTGQTNLIRLVAVDSNGCRSYKDFPVKVEGPSEAGINVRRFIGCSAQQYIFETKTPGYDPDDFTYLWDFGNGDTSSKTIINITYKDDGIYNVKLKLTEKNGCISTFTEVIDIKNERLIADYSATGLETDCPPLFAEFFNLSTAKNRRIKYSYWDFGDGSTSIETNPTKLYLKAGTYTVTLHVTDDWGCKDSLTIPDFVIVNGPEGSYDLDKDKGCVPLTVQFTSETKRTTFYEWDMGDGTVIKNRPNLSHTYTIPGRFIPLLILNDSFGCSYTLPPIDTIYVDPYPAPDFTYAGTCINYPISFQGVNNNSLDAATFMWQMHHNTGIDTLWGEDIIYTFTDIKNPKVTLTITSTNGCSNSISYTIRLLSLDANFSSINPNNCIGTVIQLLDLTKSDTTITKTEWTIDGKKYNELEPSFFAHKIGPVKIKLYHENILGCSDSIENTSIVIGDSIRPLDLEMLRVTVNDNETIQIDYKESPLLDFKQYLIYKENDWGTYSLIASIDNRQNTSFLSNGSSTLQRSYCFKIEQENSCGLISDTFTTYKHCTIETKAKGGINSNLVTWSPYYGWDSLSSYHIYRKELNTANAQQFIGTVPGNVYDYIDSALYCKIEYSYIIQGNEAAGNSQISRSDTANAIPTWKYKPPSNKLVRASVLDDKVVIVEWDSVQSSIIPISSYVVEKSTDGIDYRKWRHTNNDQFEATDSAVFVDEQSYFYRTYAIDECDDTTDFWNYGKTILLDVDTSKDQRPKADWSHYLGWTEDISHYAIEINNNGIYSQIADFPYKDTSFIDYLTDLNQRPDYCYRIVAYKEMVSAERQIISISNEDCSPVRSIIFYPNAFSPNADLLNDYYVTPSEYIKEFNIKIYNRWGEKVFESDDLEINWDGTYQGRPAKMDAYAVVVVTTGVDRVKRVHRGTITLVR